MTNSGLKGRELEEGRLRELKKRLDKFPDIFEYIIKLEKENERLKQNINALEEELKKKEDEEEERVRMIVGDL